MKKYIIVSIIVAALFVGGSIAVVKAQTAKTMAIRSLTDLLAGGLKYNYSSQLSAISQDSLSSSLESIIKNVIVPNNGGLSYGVVRGQDGIDRCWTCVQGMNCTTPTAAQCNAI